MWYLLACYMLDFVAGDACQSRYHARRRLMPIEKQPRDSGEERTLEKPEGTG